MLKYLVNNMLDLFAIKTEKFKKYEKPTNVREEIVNEIIDIFSEPCQEKNISLDYNVAQEVPETLVMDGDRMRQILFNLLQNSLKFTYTGGI
jgi:signal transduction histidine kinase